MSWTAPNNWMGVQLLEAVQRVGAIGGYDGRECGVSVDIEATDPPRGQAAHHVLCLSISTHSVGGCIPTRSVRNDHRLEFRVCHRSADQHKTWAPRKLKGCATSWGSPTGLYTPATVSSAAVSPSAHFFLQNPRLVLLSVSDGRCCDTV